MIICVSSSHGASCGTSFHQTDPLPSINPFPCIVSPTSFVKSIHHIKPELQALAFVGAMIVPSTCIIVNISGVGYGGDLAFGGDPLEQGAFLGGDATTTGAGLDAGGGDGGALRVWSTKSIIFILLNCMLMHKGVGNAKEESHVTGSRATKYKGCDCNSTLWITCNVHGQEFFVLCLLNKQQYKGH